MSRKLWTMSALSLLCLGACSSNPPSNTDAGPSGTGGAAAGTGGTTGGGTGGTTGGTGGSNGAGGAPGTGGGNGAGGSSAGVGGARGTGGSPVDAGPPADGGATSPLMNFFVTSRGLGNGGDLGGLAGADAFCKMLANAVSPALGAQTWHAYLSTTTVNARDRIGTGPWRNAAGHIIANNLTDLHDQIPANAALNATWPINDTTTALDERGNQVPQSSPGP